MEAQRYPIFGQNKKITLCKPKTLKIKNLTYNGIALGSILLLIGCTEPFNFKAPETDSLLVVEATITNEDKIQRVLLSRSSALDTVVSIPERAAFVTVIDDNGFSVDFQDNGNGSYSSTQPFAALSNRSYILRITTSDGNSYRSEPNAINASSTIDSLYAVREFKDGSEEGVFIYLDSFDATNTATYYRYEYEETHKIIAPFYRGLEAFVVSRVPPAVGIRASDEKGFICYQTTTSRDIIQTTTTNLAEDRVNRFPIRFINRENYILSHRYSILVKQFVQSLEAFTYYETLAALSSSENVFSQIQPGFLEGNISSDQNNSEQVIGFFEVASVNEKRLFFNYEDLFPGEALPDYIIECGFVSPELVNPAGRSPLIDAIDFNLLDFLAEYDGVANPLGLDAFGPYLMTPAGCGDCTQFGSTVIPDFWEE